MLPIIREAQKAGARTLREIAAREASLRRAGDSINHLVGCGKYRFRKTETECLCGLQIDNQLVFGRGLHWHIIWFLALKDAVDISRGPTKRLVRTRPITDQTTVHSIIAIRIDSWQLVACS